MAKYFQQCYLSILHLGYASQIDISGVYKFDDTFYMYLMN